MKEWNHLISNSTNTLNFNPITKEYTAARSGELIKYKFKTSKHMRTDVCIWGKESNIFYPKIDDIVIGWVVSKSIESFMLDINSPTLAVLSSTEFWGASKKNKPKIDVGDLVFAKVLKQVDKFYKPVLTCIHQEDMKDFNSGEAYFG